LLQSGGWSLDGHARGRLGDDGDCLLDDQTSHFTAASVQIRKKLECCHGRTAEFPPTIFKTAIIDPDV